MSRNPFYKLVQITLIGLLVLLNAAEGKVLSPKETDQKEILTINGKRRSYYQLHGNSLTYEIKGPKRIKIIARRAVPKRDEQEKTFGYQLQLDSLSAVSVEHSAFKSKGVTSSQHPGHAYTKSGHYYVNIPDGNNLVTINPMKKRSKPVLIRVVENKTDKPKNLGTFIQPDSSVTHHITQQGKRVRYTPLAFGNSFQISGKDFSQILIYSRLAFQNWMNGVDTYRLKISKGQELIGTYFFSTERSEISEVEEDKTVIPAKWRSCEILVESDDSPYTIELLDEGKLVYVRCMGFKNEDTDAVDAN